MNASSQTPGALPPETPYQRQLVPVPLPTTLSGMQSVADLQDSAAATTTVLSSTVTPATPDAPHHLRTPFPEPAGRECFMCGTNESLLYPDPRGRRYDSGAPVLYCGTHVPDATPVQAAAKVMASAMENGSATPRELAQAEENAGLLFDPQRAQDIADGAREQARAESAAEIARLREEVASLAHFKAQLDGIRSALAGRPDSDLMFVREILAAADPQAPFGAPLSVTWDGIVMGPSGDTLRERTLVPLTTSHGGKAALALGAEQRLALGGLLLTHTHTGETCPTPDCGIEAVTLDEADPTMEGWILVQVAGTDSPARWYCNPWCASAAISEAGAELAADDQADAVDPDQQASAVPVVEDDDEPRCVRCGCTDSRACPGGCHWIPNQQMVDLCSVCATPDELAYAAGGAR
ncbi:hypothetical protein C1I97_25185 [Streptomyces sp. NTH33]|uniref:hypothetical protein n=1 Tax=Streptomyces sp. NTH33 TaxID=1735453 RepID=UPI000DAAA571|nr:hypothetical protein [Streptomyces sp. NTH33]PZG97832.1 hypothetical protein C1I97_25185 [Streptomyces sp. NTH33]